MTDNITPNLTLDEPAAPSLTLEQEAPAAPGLALEQEAPAQPDGCLLYTSDAADEL